MTSISRPENLLKIILDIATVQSDNFKDTESKRLVQCECIAKDLSILEKIHLARWSVQEGLTCYDSAKSVLDDPYSSGTIVSLLFDLIVCKDEWEESV